MFNRYLFGFLALLGLAACSSEPLQALSQAQVRAQNAPQQASRPVTTIDVATAHQWITSDPHFMILDLRTPQEVAQGKIERSQMLNFYDAGFKTTLAQMDRNQPYIIYCRSGNRSGQALEIMREMGFRKVFNMAGGILAWQDKGFPLTNASNIL